MSGRLVNRQGSRRIFSLLLASGLFWSLATRSIMAQQGDPRDKPISPFRTTDTPGANPKPSAKDKQSADRKPQTRAFVIAPQLPISSPALGSGVVPVFAYIFPTGTAGKACGYTAGRDLDRYMFGTQLEYRLALRKRFGVVGFGGLGE